MVAKLDRRAAAWCVLTGKPCVDWRVTEHQAVSWYRPEYSKDILIDYDCIFTDIRAPKWMNSTNFGEPQSPLMPL